MSQRPSSDARPQEETGFRPWHFFVLASLMAATAGVVLSHGSSPTALVLLSLTIGAAGVTGIGLVRMLAPLAGAGGFGASEALGERTRAALEREKKLVLRTIKELEFDRAMGKVSAPDFDEVAARLRARAIALMKQVDQGRPAYGELIERELLTRLARSGASVAPGGGESLSPSAGVTAAGEKDSRPLFPSCASCGAINDADARFCKQCGTRLEVRTS
jgi:hypothetical protein